MASVTGRSCTPAKRSRHETRGGAIPDHDEEVREPDNSTVDDWFGQNVARDQDVADEAEADGDAEEAEQLYEQRAQGEESEPRAERNLIVPKENNSCC